MNKNRQVWLIRTEDAFITSIWLQNNFVATNWSNLEDLSNFTSREQLGTYYRSTTLEDANQELSQKISQLHQFVNEIQIGDYVVVNANTGDEILIGIIQGEYIYQASPALPDYPHMRTVWWQNSINKSSVSIGLKKALHSPSTVTLLNEHRHEVENLAPIPDPPALIRKRNINLKEATFLLGLIATVLAIGAGILNLPKIISEANQTFRQALSKPEDILIIQDTNLNGMASDFWVLDSPPRSITNIDNLINQQEPYRCINLSESKCDAFLYFGTKQSSGYESVRITIGSESGKPLVIQGILITLVDYQDNTPMDFLYRLEGRGGGGHYNPFELHDSRIIAQPQENNLPMNYDLGNPRSSIGKSVLAQISCSDNEDDCPKYLYLQNENDIEGLELDLTTSFSTLPPGWYDFKIQIQYSYQGEVFNSSDNYRFNVIKPTTAELWSRDVFTNSLAGFPFSLNLATQDYLPKTLDLATLGNPSGFLLFEAYYELDRFYFALDMETGKFHATSDIGAYSDFGIYPSLILAPDGLNFVGEIHRDSFPIDLALIDLKTFEHSRITNSPLIREIQPAWSLSGEKVAFVAFATEDTAELRRGEGDIYVFDINHKQLERITFTPDLVESHPVWIDEHRIAFILAKSFINVSKAEEAFNDAYGIGIVDLENNEYKIINDTQVIEYGDIGLSYFNATDSLVLTHDDNNLVYDLNGKLLGNIDDSCLLLDSNPIRQLCLDATTVKVINPTTKSEQILLEWEETQLSQHSNSLTSVPIIIADVIPNGFVILDIKNGLMHQYTEDVQLVYTWKIPQLSQLLAWPIWEITLVDTSIP